MSHPQKPALDFFSQPPLLSVLSRNGLLAMASSSFRAASSAVKQSSSAAIRRFAFPGLHVGTDICQVSRIYAILAGPGASASRASPASHARSPTRAARLVRRILTPQELPDPGQAEPPASLPPRPSSTQLLAWLLAGDGSSEKESSTATATATATDGAAAPLNSPLWKAAQFLAGRQVLSLCSSCLSSSPDNSDLPPKKQPSRHIPIWT